MPKKYQPIGIGMVPSTTEAGRFLRLRRMELGLSQVELAQRADMSQSNYSTLERGKGASLANHLDGLAVALQCEPSELQMFIPAPTIGINMIPPATELGKYLRSRRLELRISQAEIAQRADMPRSTYSTLERGKGASLANHLDGLAVALQCEPSELQMFIPAPQEKKPQTALGILISSQRQSLGLSIQELADRSGIGLRHLNLLELGSRDMGIQYSTMRKLARALHLDVSAFHDFIGKFRFKEKKAESPFGGAVRSRRKELGLSSTDVAQALHTSRQFISQIELGIVGLTTNDGDTFLVQLAAVLQIDPEYLRGLRQRRRIKATKIESKTALGKFLVERRMELVLTREAVAAQTGIPSSHLFKIEKGNVARLREKTLAKLAGVLECDIAQLSELVSDSFRAKIGLETKNPAGSVSRSDDIDRIGKRR